MSQIQFDLGEDILVCVGTADSIQIGIDPMPGLQYQWSPEANLSDPNIANPYYYVTPGQTTYYTLSVSNPNDNTGCSSGVDYLEIYSEVFYFPTSATGFEVCQGDAVQIHPQFIDSSFLWYNLQYSWSPSATLSDDDILNPIAYPLQTTFYTLTIDMVTDWYKLIGCSQKHTTKVSVNPLPQPDLQDLYLPCGSLKDKQLSAPFGPDYDFAWEPAGLFSNPVLSNPYYYGDKDTTLILTITSPKGCIGSDTFHTFHQDTTAPVMVCPRDTILQCTQDTSVSQTGYALVYDNCDPNPTVIQVQQINPGTCPAEYTIVRTWYASDSVGNMDSCRQVIVVQDTTSPWLACPMDTTVIASYGFCDTYLGIPQPQVWDECSDWTLFNDYNGTDNASDTYPTGTTLVTWTLTDDCGNASSCVQTIVVRNYPVAYDDDTIVPTGAIVAFPVLGNDYDCQGLIDEGCVSIYSQPT
ncbi:MAG: hypothetical protein IH599_07650, partial [Bacteroidales bacterium]|nr:hypothetical protein [Bacteroidales bacterium]